MSCEIVQSECLRVGDNIPITLDFTQLAARRWRKAASFADNEVIRGNKSGFEFAATTGGQTGNTEPRWPKVLAGTVQDGSILWTAQAVSTLSLQKTLTSVAWAAPTGLTVSGQSVDVVAQTATAYIEADTVGTYEVTATPTFSDTPATVEGFAIEVEVKA
jgi:hypothetical protein